MRGRDDWLETLGPVEVAEIEAAAGSSERAGVALPDLTPGTFPLPTLGPRLAALREELVWGRGFHLLRGLPIERHGVAAAARMYMGLGSWIGAFVSQNAKAHLLGHVRDLGRDVDDPAVRTYQTTARQHYHADSCDVVALLCLRPARRGGLSSLVSSVAIYNEMMARRPDLAEILSRPLAIDRRGEVPAGAAPFFRLAVFNHHAGLISTYYSRRYAESAQRLAQAPRLDERHREAFDLLDELAEHLHFDMVFRPGDVQLVHNHTVLHDRTAFEDWPEPERKRHLLRLWLCPPNGRPLPELYAERWGSVEIGHRGGILVPGAEPNAPLEPV
jgi:hypothetical protein